MIIPFPALSLSLSISLSSFLSEPPLNICIHHNIQWKLCFYIRAKCYDLNWLPWSILPIFSEKEHIVVFKMNWIYAVVLLKATNGAIAILEPIQTESDRFKLGDFQFHAVSNSLHLPYTIHQDDKWKRYMSNLI